MEEDKELVLLKSMYEQIERTQKEGRESLSADNSRTISWGPNVLLEKQQKKVEQARLMADTTKAREDMAVKELAGNAHIFEVIAEGEGTDDKEAIKYGYESGYDVTLGYGAYDPYKGAKVSQMTLGEIKKFQKGILNHPKNKLNASPVGRYQIVGTTLKEAQKNMGLSDDEVFTPALQDKMALSLFGNTLKNWRAGATPTNVVHKKMARIWDSLPYEGVAGWAGKKRHKARLKDKRVLDALELAF